MRYFLLLLSSLHYKVPYLFSKFCCICGDTIRCVGKSASPITAVSAGETSVKAGGLCFVRMHRYKNHREPSRIGGSRWFSVSARPEYGVEFMLRSGCGERGIF